MYDDYEVAHRARRIDQSMHFYTDSYMANSWEPEPRAAANTDLYFGYLKTSPWMYFHPVSSWSSAVSSS